MPPHAAPHAVLLNLPADLLLKVAESLSYRDLLALFLARPSLRHTIPLSPAQSLEAAVQCASWCARSAMGLGRADGHARMKQRVNTHLRPRFGPRSASHPAANGSLRKVTVAGGAFTRKDGSAALMRPVLVVACDLFRVSFSPHSSPFNQYEFRPSPSVVVQMRQRAREWEVTATFRVPGAVEISQHPEMIREAARATAACLPFAVGIADSDAVRAAVKIIVNGTLAVRYISRADPPRFYDMYFPRRTGTVQPEVLDAFRAEGVPV